MILSAAAVALLASHCSAPIAGDLVSAIAKAESQNSTLAIHNNTTGQSFSAPDIEHAQAYVADHAGESIDAGILQVNVGNWARLGLNPLNVFDPQAD